MDPHPKRLRPFVGSITIEREAGGRRVLCLSGDVDKDFSKLWEAIREFAEVPEPLPYGQPLVKHSR